MRSPTRQRRDVNFVSPLNLCSSCSDNQEALDRALLCFPDFDDYRRMSFDGRSFEDGRYPRMTEASLKSFVRR